MPSTTLRIVRPTNNLAGLTTSYTPTLGLQTLGSCIEHWGFDGLMLDRPDYSWRLEFTRRHEATVAVQLAKSICWTFMCPRKANAGLL
jgi:hypothetical protein